jgi:hypothetical protein
MPEIEHAGRLSEREHLRPGRNLCWPFEESQRTLALLDKPAVAPGETGSSRKSHQTPNDHQRAEAVTPLGLAFDIGLA